MPQCSSNAACPAGRPSRCFPAVARRLSCPAAPIRATAASRFELARRSCHGYKIENALGRAGGRFFTRPSSLGRMASRTDRAATPKHLVLPLLIDSGLPKARNSSAWPENQSYRREPTASMDWSSAGQSSENFRIPRHLVFALPCPHGMLIFMGDHGYRRQTP